MDQKYLEKLEFNKIKEILSSFAITYLGKDLALNLSPMDNKKDILKLDDFIKDKLNFVYVSEYSQVAKVAFAE